jgi:hypothetical protein
MAKILSKLRGGDRRSIGKVGEVVTAVRKKPDLFKELLTGLFDADPVIRLCACALLMPWKKYLWTIPNFYSHSKQNSFASLNEPHSKETARVTEIFFEYLKDKSKIVVTFAMQALSDLAIKEADGSTRVIRAIEKLTQTGSPAIQSRGKKLLAKLKNFSQRCKAS